MQFGSAIPDVIPWRLSIDDPEKSDDALIEGIAAGDKRALMVLFAHHNVRVYRFALRLTGSGSLAEDIVYETFLNVWHQAAGFDAKCHVSTWLLRITRHEAVSAMRRRSDGQLDRDCASTIEHLEDNPADSTGKSDRRAALQRGLRQLSSTKREIIDLVYYHEKSIAEVATILHAPENTVKMRMLYARKRLAEPLATEGI